MAPTTVGRPGLEMVSLHEKATHHSLAQRASVLCLLAGFAPAAVAYSNVSDWAKSEVAEMGRSACCRTAC